MQLPFTTVPPAEVHARGARTDDLDDVAALHRAALELSSSERGGSVLAADVGRGADPAELTASLTADLHDLDRSVLVATLGDVVFGHAVLVVPPAGSPMRTAVIRELFVDPDARRVGLGTALLVEATRIARDADCTGIDALALPGDRATKNFFEDHAMVARAIVVHRTLEPE